MQDPDDGGVYHKLTTAQFCDFIMPEEDDGTRYIVKKGTAATLDLLQSLHWLQEFFENLKVKSRGWQTVV